jgi:uncharacterized protein (UPF0335 family)
MAKEATPEGVDKLKPELIQGYINRIENLQEAIASIMGEAMNECRQQHEDIKEIFTEAKAEGVPLKALRAQLKLRKLDRQKERWSTASMKRTPSRSN